MKEHVARKLNRRQVEEIRSRREKGEGLLSISRDYPVCEKTIGAVCAGIIYKVFAK